MSAHRRTLALSAAAAALACAAPVLANPQPIPERDDGTAPFHGHAAPHAPETYYYPEADQPMAHDDGIVIDERAAAYPPRHAYPQPYAYGYPPMMHHPSAPPRFDRQAWLEDCRARIRGVDRKDRGGVIGGLLGGIAGGIIGNRAYDSERLAGTLIGAGVGGLAGIAIGSAIGAVSDRRRGDECGWHLDRYMARGNPPGYAPQGYGYGYGYGYGGYTLVPVIVAVPQRQVVRETITEETYDVPVRARTVTRKRAHHHSAPAPVGDKRVRYIKAK